MSISMFVFGLHFVPWAQWRSKNANFLLVLKSVEFKFPEPLLSKSKLTTFWMSWEISESNHYRLRMVEHHHVSLQEIIKSKLYWTISAYETVARLEHTCCSIMCWPLLLFCKFCKHDHVAWFIFSSRKPSESATEVQIKYIIIWVVPVS